MAAMRGVLETDRVYAGIELPAAPLRVLASR